MLATAGTIFCSFCTLSRILEESLVPGILKFLPFGISLLAFAFSLSFGDSSFAKSLDIPEGLDAARANPSNYCRGVVAEGSYDPKKSVVVVVDRKGFCTYLLQVSQQGDVVSVFSTPNSNGRAGHETMLGQYSISRLIRYPVWVDPESGGLIEPYDVDRHNPLGVAAITIRPLNRSLSEKPAPELNMALHGTNREELVGGQLVSAGCIRHRNYAIALMVTALREGEVVLIVDGITTLPDLPVTYFFERR